MNSEYFYLSRFIIGNGILQANDNHRGKLTQFSSKIHLKFFMIRDHLLIELDDEGGADLDDGFV